MIIRGTSDEILGSSISVMYIVYSKYIHILHHQKLDIVSAIPASNEWKVKNW